MKQAVEAVFPSTKEPEKEEAQPNQHEHATREGSREGSIINAVPSTVQAAVSSSVSAVSSSVAGAKDEVTGLLAKTGILGETMSWQRLIRVDPGG